MGPKVDCVYLIWKWRAGETGFFYSVNIPFYIVTFVIRFCCCWLSYCHIFLAHESDDTTGVVFVSVVSQVLNEITRNLRVLLIF